MKVVYFTIVVDTDEYRRGHGQFTIVVGSFEALYMFNNFANDLLLIKYLQYQYENILYTETIYKRLRFFFFTAFSFFCWTDI